jgi:hypothetical protein
MGTWGASLYDDDEAGDLKNAIAAVCKVPGDGDRLLSLLKEMYGARDPASDEGSLFWLVVADQFERRGLRCAEATANALAIIRGGADLARASAHGADAAFIRKRTRVLEELSRRLSAPRPQRQSPKSQKAPELVLEPGEVYAFPTMRGNAWHPYRLASAGAFTPDAWGAMVVLETGRAFEWLPWVALASLSVPPERKPTLEAALAARLIPHPETEGAGRFVPKRAHLRGLGAELVGRVRLDPVRVAPHLSRWPIPRAIQYDWTIAYAAIAPTAAGIEVGCALSSLLC